MESLNLNTLASSLQAPKSASLQSAEAELMNNFKAAALSITNFYRSSRKTSNKAYNAGYAAACQDLLVMIQQGVSAGAAVDGGMTIGRVMDWIEARLEAVKSREEEEEEDEEKEREPRKGQHDSAAASTATTKKTAIVEKSASEAAPTAKQQRDVQLTTSIPATISSTSHRSRNNHLPSQPSSPSPPPARLLPATSSGLRSNTSIRSRPTKDTSSNGADISPSIPFIFGGTPSPTAQVPIAMPMQDLNIPINAGAKRRHAVMMMLDSPSTPLTGSLDPMGGSPLSPGTPVGGMQGGASCNMRRRTRSSRGGTGIAGGAAAAMAAMNQNVNATENVHAMDVEEDSGRERKRATRR